MRTVLRRLEPPRQAGLDVGVEPDPDLAGDRARRSLGAQRSAVEAGQLAEQAVKRHRGEGQADHRRDDQRHQHRRARVLALVGLGERRHQFAPILAMVMKNSSTAKAPSSNAMHLRPLALAADHLVLELHASHRSATSAVNRANR